ncbi:SusC/RagA family TonB-linked outer membrane protein [Labilibacter marinus]|uniref:SusC/RagA family TonB-linked outer membrane protein n=1 Tax=Labilibacter marinus TaxID=1477105 RepID=UPI00095022A9|nr:TonB-dependent receptor [Labilibacter marinus]
MEKLNKFKLVLLVLMTWSVFSYGQQKQITGKVISKDDGLPLPGVSAVVKGTSIGTATDVNGKFNLSVSSDASTLVFSFIGFEIKEVDITGKTTVDVALETSSIGLDEVVAIGYGTVKKSDLTGAVSTISNDVLEEQPTARIEHALQGRSPGVVVQRSGGNVARDDMKIRIRGTNSITGNNQPLIVVDGFLGGNLGEINPQDVASMEVLSDASATSIYGSRGSNGVILVTTKKGKAGKVKVSYNGNVGWDKIYNKMDLYGAVDYMELHNQIGFEESGINNKWFSDAEIDAYRNGSKQGTDWQDAVFRTGFKQEHQVSFSGGNDKSKFFNSIGYSEMAGIMLNDEFQRITFRSNYEHKINEKVTTTLNVNFMRKEGSQGYYYPDRMQDVYTFSPNIPVIDPETGDYSLAGPYGSSTAENPVQTVEIKDNVSISNKFQANFGLDYEILKGLKYSFYLGSVFYNSNGRGFSRYKAGESPSSSSVNNNSTTSYSWQINNQLTYQVESGDHNLNLVLVQEAAKSEGLNDNASNSTLLTNSLGYYNIGVGSTPSVGSGYVNSQLASFLGRANYSFANKYLLSLSMRADGSSKFAPGNQWAYYPSGAIAWHMHKEPFFESLRETVNSFKVRFSHGQVGSQAIDSYATMSSLIPKTIALDSKTLSNAAQLGAPANPDLKWETTTQTNVGFNSSFFEGRLTLDFDYYHKNTTDLLYGVPFPRFAGVPRKSWNQPAEQLMNVGEMENKGYTVDLRGIIFSSKDFMLELGANMSYNNNTFVGFSGVLADEERIALSNSQAGSSMNGIQVFYLTPGHSLGDIHGLDYLGTWKQSEASQAALYNALPGHPKYLDVPGEDGSVDYKYSNDDARVLGNGLPKYNVGFSVNMVYKNFDLSALFQGALDFDILYIDKFMTQNYMISKRMDNRYTSQNESDIWSHYDSFVTASSTDYLEKGDYLRLNNLTLGYTLPESVIQKIGLSNCRVYANGQNLFTITGFSGLDPSVTSTGTEDLKQGVAWGAYPIPRTFSLGVNLSF